MNPTGDIPSLPNYEQLTEQINDLERGDRGDEEIERLLELKRARFSEATPEQKINDLEKSAKKLKDRFGDQQDAVIEIDAVKRDAFGFDPSPEELSDISDELKDLVAKTDYLDEDPRG